VAKVAETITANEAAYLQRKVARQEAAQIELQDYAGHLFAAYGLRPGLDSIQPDGVIVRGKEPKTAAPPPFQRNGVAHDTTPDAKGD
jgi:hypothetical protein